MNHAWRKLTEYAKAKNINVQKSGRLPEYEIWHDSDHGNIHNVDTIDEAIESIDELHDQYNIAALA